MYFFILLLLDPYGLLCFLLYPSSCEFPCCKYFLHMYVYAVDAIDAVDAFSVFNKLRYFQ